ALLADQRNSINQAISDLEHSESLNNNRAVFRSKDMLDQDAAVRSANLALIYKDAGLNDVAVREATKSVQDDYANYSAHLFLSDTYDALRDPKDANLRYQTPWEDELLVANLLAPVGAGILSQSVSQQEYSKLFTSDGAGIFSQTEFFSRGAWIENASQFGAVDDMAYSLNGFYYSDPGWRPNNDIENSDFSAQVKYQLDPKDTLFLQIERTEVDAGDVLEHYSYNTPAPGPNNELLNVAPDYDPSVRQTEIQDPNILVGYHRDWGNGNQTIALYRGLQDYFTANDANYSAPLLSSDGAAGIFPHVYSAVTALQSTTELNSVEAQHIFQNDLNEIIVGTRYQAESIQTANTLFEPAIFAPTGTPLPGVPQVDSDFERFSAYGYYTLKLFDSLRLTAGATYDWERFPLNIAGPPLSNAEDERGRLSPKAGIDWTLAEGTRLRADYTRSMSGLLNDSSTLIEPSEVGGFNQEFRSLIPESAGKGTPPATRFETGGLGLDHKFSTGTYVDIEGQLLTSRGNQLIGAWTSGAVSTPAAVANLSQSQYFQEKDAFASVSQLIGKNLSLGANDTLTSIDLSTIVPTPPGTTSPTAFNTHEDSTLNELSFFANFYVPCGFFSQFQANWWKQENIAAMGEPGDSFAQFNLYAGYRFPRRHAEVMVGVVNIGNQDYNIDPVTYFLEQAHSRTFVASFKFNF
ncbi:MAG TPA: TonB-dependent receptor, partial [Verrucomicrobiae bacterium]|nr:TonB-dependent receptor [Verrucomicrobiae bacterium]